MFLLIDNLFEYNISQIMCFSSALYVKNSKKAAADSKAEPAAIFIAFELMTELISA